MGTFGSLYNNMEGPGTFDDVVGTLGSGQLGSCAIADALYLLYCPYPRIDSEYNCFWVSLFVCVLCVFDGYCNISYFLRIFSCCWVNPRLYGLGCSSTRGGVGLLFRACSFFVLQKLAKNASCVLIKIPVNTIIYRPK